MSINQIRQGELGLHVVSFNDMSHEDFIKGIRDQEEIDFILKDTLQFMARVPEHRMSILQALEAASEAIAAPYLSGQKELPVETQEFSQVVTGQAVQAFDPNAGATPHAPVQAQFIAQVGFVRPEVLITDQGNFNSLETLKHNLSELFPLCEDIDKVFTNVALSMTLPKGVNYLSMPVFTKFIIVAKKALEDDVVRSLGGDPESITATPAEKFLVEKEGLLSEIAEMEKAGDPITHGIRIKRGFIGAGKLIGTFTSRKLAVAAAKEHNENSTTPVVVIKL